MQLRGNNTVTKLRDFKAKQLQRKKLAANRSMVILLHYCLYITFKYYVFTDRRVWNISYSLNIGFSSFDFFLYGKQS